MKKKVYTIIAIILIIAAFFAGYSIGKFKFISQSENLNITTLKSELSAISELATYEYTYSDEITETTQLRFADKYDIPFTSNKYTISYDGIIKVGFDFSTLDVALVEDVIEIRLPQSKVLDQYAVDSSIQIVDQKNNILNPFELQDIFDLISKENSRQLSAAEGKGLITLANENAKSIIRDFITKVYGEDTVIRFK